MSPIIELCNIKEYFPVMKGSIFQKTIGHIRAIDDVSFVLNEGKTFGLVGGEAEAVTASQRAALDSGFISNSLCG